MDIELEDEEEIQASKDVEELAAEWNHLIKERVSSYAGLKGDADEAPSAANALDDDDDADWLEGDEEEGTKDKPNLSQPAATALITPAKVLRKRLSVESSPRDGRPPASASFLVSRFGAPQVSKALQLLEASLLDSPAKIPEMVAVNTAVSETQEEMLRLQEDRLLEDLEALLGSEGLTYLDDLCALFE